MGTSNYEWWGGKIPEYFAHLHDGDYDRAMELYWQIQPARAARAAEQATFGGANFIHRYLWKYQAWLQGYNGGPLRQPAMKLADAQMRRLREALQRSGYQPETADFAEFSSTSACTSFAQSCSERPSRLVARRMRSARRS